MQLSRSFGRINSCLRQIDQHLDFVTAHYTNGDKGIRSNLLDFSTTFRPLILQHLPILLRYGGEVNFMQRISAQIELLINNDVRLEWLRIDVYTLMKTLD
jgi:hypothetical protein